MRCGGTTAAMESKAASSRPEDVRPPYSSAFALLKYLKNCVFGSSNKISEGLLKVLRYALRLRYSE